jgi:asparagine synthase (glutamine-hydrolysing)
MANEDNTLFLIYNGEIYNTLELRKYCEDRGHRFRSHSDGEVILHLWEIEGPDSLARLNGIFALALADGRTGEVVLARDRMGVKPLFVVADDKEMWFASEISALEMAGARLGSFDTVGLAQFLSFLWIPDPRTPYRNCRSLLPGGVLRWSGGEVFETSITPITEEASQAGDVCGEDLVEQGRAFLQQAVERQLLSDVPIGIMASGGIDSSLLWWAAGDRLQSAITIDWSGDQDTEGLSEDTEAVRALSAITGTPVEYASVGQRNMEELPPSGDLFADPAYHLTRLIAEYASGHGMKVLLSGHGGDEVFAGYRRHLVVPMLERIRVGGLGSAMARLLSAFGGRSVHVEYLARLCRAASQSDELSAYMQLCTYSNAAERARVLGCTEAEVSDEVVWQQHRTVFDALPQQWSLLRRVRALDLAVYMPGLGLAYTDRAAMRHGVEVRVPWLDLDLVRWGLRLPDDALVRGRTGKWLPRQIARQVLPELISTRPKRGFGIPTSMIRRDGTSAGSRGFRQGTYFSHAEEQLRQYMAG